MHHLRKFNRSLLLLLPFAALVLSACVPKLTPQMSHQGRLVDESGNPVPDGDYDVVYSIFQVATGGTAVYTEAQSVPVKDGLFTTSLGLTGPIDAKYFAQPTWLEVSVEGEILTPRQRLQGAPYAFSLSSGSVVQGSETIARDYLTYTDTGAALTAVNLDLTETGGHGLAVINIAAPTGADRDKTAALYVIAGGGEFDSSDGNPETGAYGAIVRSESYRGLYATGGEDTAGVLSDYYAAIFNGNSGISITGGGGCNGCTMAYTARNTGDAPIQAGDFVAVSNVTVDADLNIPVMEVHRATAADSAVIGVAQGALARSAVGISNGMQTGGYDPLAGPAKSGDYVNVVVNGLVQARAADGSLQPGAAVTVGAEGVSAATGGQGIARAMSAVDANGMVWVMVNSAYGQ